jgi:hypothetical protein
MLIRVDERTKNMEKMLEKQHNGYEECLKKIIEKQESRPCDVHAEQIKTLHDNSSNGGIFKAIWKAITA